MRTRILFEFEKVSYTTMYMCVDDMDNIYFTNPKHRAVNKVDAKGKVHCVVEPLETGFRLVGCHSFDTSSFCGLVVTDDGTLYIGQYGGVRIVRNGVTSTLLTAAGPMNTMRGIYPDADGKSVLAERSHSQRLFRLSECGVGAKILIDPSLFISDVCACKDGVFCLSYFNGRIANITAKDHRTIEVKNVDAIACHQGILFVAKRTRLHIMREQNSSTVEFGHWTPSGVSDWTPLDTQWVFSRIVRMVAKNGFLYVADDIKFCVTRTLLFKAWAPPVHRHMSKLFRDAVKTALLMRFRRGTVWSHLPREIAFTVFEWFYATY